MNNIFNKKEKNSGLSIDRRALHSLRSTFAKIHMTHSVFVPLFVLSDCGYRVLSRKRNVCIHAI